MTFDRQGQLLYEAASKAIRATMEEGRLRGYDGEWMKQSAEKHLDHADKHLTMLELDNRDEDHLAHALTRLAMAMVLSGRYE
jgi:hypothetical protein